MGALPMRAACSGLGPEPERMRDAGFFTGGSGKAGKHVIPYLVEQGHRVLNFDKVSLGGAGVHDLLGDITDAGQVYSAPNSHAGYDELETGQGGRAFDAVVHFAAIPRMMMCPDTET